MIYQPNLSFAPAWIFDLDGTLATMTERGPFDWDRVGEDLCVQPVASAAAGLSASAAILIVSGRDGSCEEQTLSWLEDNAIPFSGLFMRPAGDYRKDSAVKEEIFWRDIAPIWNVLGVFDDRNQVVDMWRSIGLTCFQVAPGDF
jgi:hypothetical protein